MYTCYIKKFKILTSFCSWAGWFESYLVENPRRHIFACYGSFLKRLCPCHFCIQITKLMINWGHHRRSKHSKPILSKVYNITCIVYMYWRGNITNKYFVRKIRLIECNWCISIDSGPCNRSNFTICLIFLSLNCISFLISLSAKASWNLLNIELEPNADNDQTLSFYVKLEQKSNICMSVRILR